jgi:hypothetical protein
VPLAESKKFLYAASLSRNACCNTTAETSARNAFCGFFFASVIRRFDRIVPGIQPPPASYGAFRAASAWLYTHRAHPNALVSAMR